MTTPSEMVRHGWQALEFTNWVPDYVSLDDNSVTKITS